MQKTCPGEEQGCHVFDMRECVQFQQDHSHSGTGY